MSLIGGKLIIVGGGSTVDGLTNCVVLLSVGVLTGVSSKSVLIICEM